MEPDTDMECYEDEGLPSVDDLTVVSEIAEAELRQLEKIQAVAVRAREFRKQRMESQQRSARAADGTQDLKIEGISAINKVRINSNMPGLFVLA
jgi:predicted ATPase